MTAKLLRAAPRKYQLDVRGNSQKMTWPQTQPEQSPMGPSYKIVRFSMIE